MVVMTKGVMAMNPFVRPCIIADRRETKDDDIRLLLVMSSSFEFVDDNGVVNNRRAGECTTGEYASTKAIVMRKSRGAATKRQLIAMMMWIGVWSFALAEPHGGPPSPFTSKRQHDSNLL
jgi:hypothetical protein